MEAPSAPKQKLSSSRLIFCGIFIGGIGGAFTLGYMVYTAIQMVSAGKGLETYRTHWLVNFNWYGFLAFMLLLFLAIATGLYFRWREHMEWKSLAKKYSPRKPHT
jgi:hypothetical protein